MEQSKEDGDAMQSALTSIASTRAEWLKWSSPLLWRNQICFQFRKIQLRLRWNWMPTRNILHLFQTYRSNSGMIETSHCPSVYKFAMGGCQQNILTFSAIRALGGATKDWFAENRYCCNNFVYVVCLRSHRWPVSVWVLIQDQVKKSQQSTFLSSCENNTKGCLSWLRLILSGISEE